MPKKCTICGKEANFCIKDSSDFYCEECAEDLFDDLSCLVKAEEQASALKDALDH